MRKISDKMLEEHLSVLNQVREVETDEFFYTRLRGRMQAMQTGSGWAFPVRPVWLVGAMLIMLVANSLVLTADRQQKNTETSSGISNVAKNYDQTIYSPY